jgi:3-isopropylmalate/(R)-2-methylmalate dehydratase small subunit
VSPRFGDIFRNNATKNGLVPVVVPPDVGETLLRAVEAEPGLELTIDVGRRTLSAAGTLDIECAFPLDDATRERFIEGLDDIAISLRHAAAIDDHEARRPDWMPTAG